MDFDESDEGIEEEDKHATEAKEARISKVLETGKEEISAFL